MFSLAGRAAPGEFGASGDLGLLSIEELSEIRITSVSRKPERLSEAAAAVYVITRAEVLRSGATTLPEVLRLAPNLEVARTNGNSAVVTARGSTTTNANKMLVLIDGRVVYNPLDAGVFWEAQDVLLEEIERIEVISGPGGTLWGSNAVNGVINILTRSAQEGPGSMLQFSAGNGTRGAAASHSWNIGGDVGLRVYAKGFDDGAGRTAAGTPAADGWRGRQAGFRADGGTAQQGWTLQGDLYDRSLDQLRQPDRTRSGGNVLARWSRTADDASSAQWQLYADRVAQNAPGTLGFTEFNDTYDIQYQQRLAPGAVHDIVWGGGYRVWRSASTSGGVIAFVPGKVRRDLSGVFMQDEMTVGERLKLIGGVKVEHNDYSGTEVQPNVRLAFQSDRGALLWTAVSRVVRTPSRVDSDFYVFHFPGAAFRGGPDFHSERLTAFEAGYRAHEGARLNYSVNAFYNRYGMLRSVEPGPVAGTLVIANKNEGFTAGLEAWANLQLNEQWRLFAGGRWLRERFHFRADSARLLTFGSPTSLFGNDPAHQLNLRASATLPNGVEADFAVRRVGALPDPAVPAYTTFDARLAWLLRPRLDISLAVSDLFNRRHQEFGNLATAATFGRSAIVKLMWKF